MQKFLAIHPDNKANGGSIFEEYDPAKEASIEIEKEDQLFEAQSLVRSISPLKQDAVARLMCSDYDEKWVPAELKRSLYSAVAKSPAKFLGFEIRSSVRGPLRRLPIKDERSKKRFLIKKGRISGCAIARR